ncbi:MAG: hypothetical protein NT154_13430, partial [Verrucomicrobia bacterium]|nr:hypothetical protein [Verrucomicrobiota bacterium]
MKSMMTAMLSAAILSLASICVYGERGLSVSELREKETAKNRVPFLSDANYDESMRQVEGLDYVAFFRGGAGVNDAVLLKNADLQTNRFKFFKVNLDENPHLMERLENLKLGASSWRTVENGKESLPFANNNQVGLLLFDGVGLEHCYGADFSGVDNALCRWLREGISDLERSRRGDDGAAQPVKESPNQAGSASDVSFLTEAIEQLNIPKAGWQESYLLPWRALENVPRSALKPAVPALSKLLTGKYETEAKQALAYIGEPAASVSGALLKDLDRLSQPDAKWPRSVHSPEFATVQAVGSIGPAAKAAVPMLKRIAERGYKAALMKMGDPMEQEGSLLGLVAATALNHISPAEPGKLKEGVVTGKTITIITGRASGSYESG